MPLLKTNVALSAGASALKNQALRPCRRNLAGWAIPLSPTQFLISSSPHSAAGRLRYHLGAILISRPRHPNPPVEKPQTTQPLQPPKWQCIHHSQEHCMTWGKFEITKKGSKFGSVNPELARCCKHGKIRLFHTHCFWCCVLPQMIFFYSLLAFMHSIPNIYPSPKERLIRLRSRSKQRPHQAEGQQGACLERRHNPVPRN